MEKWEQKYIEKHLSDLARLTICRRPLLDKLKSAAVIGDSDIAALEAIPNEYARSSALYSLLPSRRGAYNVLINLLGETNQTGAQDLLNRGLTLCNKSGKSDSCNSDESNNQEMGRNLSVSETEDAPLLECNVAHYSNVRSEPSNNTRQANLKVPLVVCTVVVCILVLVVILVELLRSSKPSPIENSKYTLATILLIGPVGPGNMSNLRLNLLDFILSCPYKNVSDTDSIVKYEIRGLAPPATFGDFDETNYDFRLVLIDVPLLKQDANIFYLMLYLKRFLHACKTESKCGIFVPAFFLPWTYETWDETKISHFVSSIVGWKDGNSSSVLSRSVLLFEDENKTLLEQGQQFYRIVGEFFDRSFIPELIRAKLILFDSCRSTFLPFLESNLPSGSASENALVREYFSILKHANSPIVCTSVVQSISPP